VSGSTTRGLALSTREDAVLQLLAAGLTVGQVANRLVLSVKTVSTYRERILEKMGLTTTAELVQRVIVARAIKWIEATFGPLTAAHQEQLLYLFQELPPQHEHEQRTSDQAEAATSEPRGGIGKLSELPVWRHR